MVVAPLFHDSNTIAAFLCVCVCVCEREREREREESHCLDDKKKKLGAKGNVLCQGHVLQSVKDCFGSTIDGVKGIYWIISWHGKGALISK